MECGIQVLPGFSQELQLAGDLVDESSGSAFISLEPWVTVSLVDSRPNTQNGL